MSALESRLEEVQAMRVVRTIEEVRAASRAFRAAGDRVAFVPTMGALHEGHLSLLDAARKAGGARVIASIFVNPTQFGPGEDLEAYPRDEAADCALLEARGADVVFLPSVDTIYPPGSETSVSLSRLPHHLCGLSRPVHFGGVATVVSLLFNIVEPDLAVFGQKDFQQLQVIRRMVRDLHFGIEIVGAPIVREYDGLAMSSRNRYLEGKQRERAALLHRALQHARARVSGGETSAAVIKEGISAVVAPAGTVDYISIVNEETLEDVDRITGPVRALVAVQVGPARLIDNMRLP